MKRGRSVFVRTSLTAGALIVGSVVASYFVGQTTIESEREVAALQSVQAHLQARTYVASQTYYPSRPLTSLPAATRTLYEPRRFERV